MDGVRYTTKQLIDQYLIKNGMSSLTGTKGHEVKNPKRAIYPVKCPICGATNLSSIMRCKGCDAFLVQPKPTGTAEQQTEYLKEYAENYEGISKQLGFDKTKAKAVRKKVNPPDK